MTSKHQGHYDAKNVVNRDFNLPRNLQQRIQVIIHFATSFSPLRDCFHHAWQKSPSGLIQYNNSSKYTVFMYLPSTYEFFNLARYMQSWKLNTYTYLWETQRKLPKWSVQHIVFRYLSKKQMTPRNINYRMPSGTRPGHTLIALW